MLQSVVACVPSRCLNGFWRKGCRLKICGLYLACLATLFAAPGKRDCCGFVYIVFVLACFGWFLVGTRCLIFWFTRVCRVVRVVRILLVSCSMGCAWSSACAVPVRTFGWNSFAIHLGSRALAYRRWAVRRFKCLRVVPRQGLRDTVHALCQFVFWGVMFLLLTSGSAFWCVGVGFFAGLPVCESCAGMGLGPTRHMHCAS